MSSEYSTVQSSLWSLRVGLNETERKEEKQGNGMKKGGKKPQIEREKTQEEPGKRESKKGKGRAIPRFTRTKKSGFPSLSFGDYMAFLIGVHIGSLFSLSSRDGLTDLRILLIKGLICFTL